uniref:Uncharacterized protein n=1 Tax=Acanthochromis polyacanthus TaxID=80966 RepID=A0A3Q1EB85_9TELE
MLIYANWGALMHFPRISSEVLMFPASFRRSPLFWVLAQRSEPARSQRHNLETETHLFIYTEGARNKCCAVMISTVRLNSAVLHKLGAAVWNLRLYATGKDKVLLTR